MLLEHLNDAQIRELFDTSLKYHRNRRDTYNLLMFLVNVFLIAIPTVLAVFVMVFAGFLSGLSLIPMIALGIYLIRDFNNVVMESERKIDSIGWEYSRGFPDGIG